MLNHKNLDINYKNSRKVNKIKSDYYRGDKISLRKSISEEITSLYLAIEKENIEIVKILLTNEKININIPIKQSINWYYRSRNSCAMFDSLSYDERKERIQERNMLYIAIEKGDIDLIELLLSCEKLDINLPNKFYKSWIKYPVSYEYGYDENEEQSKIKAIYDIENKNITALHFAITTENIEIVELLLLNINIDVNILSNCSKSIKNNVRGDAELDHDEGDSFDRKFDDNDECVDWIEEIEQTENKTPLYLAVENNNIDICKDLLSNKNIDINLLSKSSLIKKIATDEEEEEEVANSSEKKEIKLNNQRTPLHLAVENGEIEIIQLLLNSERIDVNSKDENEKTPIEYTQNEIIKKMFTH